MNTSAHTVVLAHRLVPQRRSRRCLSGGSITQPERIKRRAVERGISRRSLKPLTQGFPVYAARHRRSRRLSVARCCLAPSVNADLLAIHGCGQGFPAVGSRRTIGRCLTGPRGRWRAARVNHDRRERAKRLRGTHRRRIWLFSWWSTSRGVRRRRYMPCQTATNHSLLVSRKIRKHKHWVCVAAQVPPLRHSFSVLSAGAAGNVADGYDEPRPTAGNAAAPAPVTCCPGPCPPWAAPNSKISRCSWS